MARINLFETFPSGDLTVNTGHQTLFMNCYYVPGSLSFNTPFVLLSNGVASNVSVSVSLGLYSLNGNTLSLANSASGSWSAGAATLSWVSLVTSAPQDITPGNWYLGVITQSGGTTGASILCNNAVTASLIDAANVYGGPFFRGMYSATTTAFPASIATSAMSKEGANANANNYRQPYIVLAA